MARYHPLIIAFATSWLLVPAVSAQGLTPPQIQPTSPLSAQTPTGDAKRGKELFDKTYRCYACHGFDGQTGSPRLVPMARSQEAFLTYVRKPSTEGMPKFPTVPERDLVDVYAYIRSIPVAAPPVETIPQLKDVLDRRARSN